MIDKNLLVSRKQRGGFSFIHAMLLVVVAVILTLCASGGTIPFLQQSVPSLGIPKFQPPNISMSSLPWVGNDTTANRGSANADNSSFTPNTGQGNVQWTDTLINPANSTLPAPRGIPDPPALVDAPYDIQFPKNLASGFYTVQVFSGYNSQYAYELRRSLRQDGYLAYLRTEEKPQGVLFKIRIGQYRNRAEAFAMREQIKRRYAKTLSGSYVILSPENPGRL